MQQQQKKEKKECEVEQLLIPILKKLEPESFEIKKQLIIYINNSQMRQEQFQQVLKNRQLNFENIDQGLIIQSFNENATMLYFQNLIDVQQSIGSLIRAREFLYQICSKDIVQEIHFVFHYPSKFQKNKENLDQFLKIFGILNMVIETISDQIMSFIQGDNIEQQFSMKMNITCMQLFQKNVNEDQMKINDCLQFIQQNTSYNKINQSPNEVDNIIFQYIQSQLMIIFDELFNEIEIVISYLLKLLEFDFSDEKNKDYLNFRQLLLSILQNFPKDLNLPDILNSKSHLNNYFQKLVPQHFKGISVSLTKIIGKNLEISSQEYKFLSDYQFNFQLPKYIKILQHYQFYLPFDKINTKYSYYFQTVEQWKKNYHLQIELKLWKISQIINLNFLKRDDKLKSVFVLGLSKVGKSTLLNILKNYKNLRIVDDKINYQCYFEAIEDDDQLKISSVCISETESLQSFKIEKKLYFDTPGFDDTNYKVRLRNTLNIYQGINSFSQVAFILLFDAQEILNNKTNFLKTIDKFIELVGEDFLKLDLDKYVLPIFTKAYLQTIDKIKQQWDNIIKDTNVHQQKILNLIQSQFQSNYQVVIYNAKLILDQMDLYSYLKEVNREVNNICDIMLKQQYGLLLDKPKLKLTLQPELQYHFQTIIPCARQIFEFIVQYVQEEVKTQLLEMPQEQETIDNFIKETEKIINIQQASLIDSSEILEQFFVNAQKILNFEYNKYFQKLASQYFKFIEVSKNTNQQQQFEKEKKYDFQVLRQFLINLEKASKQAQNKIAQEKKKYIQLTDLTKLGKNLQQGIGYCQPLAVLLCLVAAEVCIAAVVASLAVDAGLELFKNQLEKEQEEIQNQATRLRFQYFLKQSFLEITKNQ